MEPSKKFRQSTELEIREYCETYDGRRCWNCRFFDEFEAMNSTDYISEDGHVTATRRHWDGFCRRHAPAPIQVEIDEDADRETRWPVVFGSDWCGEHRPIEGCET